MAKATDSDRRLAESARAKLRTGGRPTKLEERALARVKREAEEQLREKLCRSIPKKLWREWSGRQHKTIGEQAARYGIPLGSATIDIAAVARWIHDFFAQHGKHLPTVDDVLPAGTSQELKDEYTRQQIREKKAKADAAELDVAEREGVLRHAAAFREMLGQLAAIRRRTAETVQRLFGPEPVRILNEGLEDEARLLGDYFDDNDGNDDDAANRSGDAR